MWNTLRRWRTWILNTAAALLIILPDIFSVLAGFDWGTIVPPKYLPYVALGIAILNIWMRPRPAVLPHDEEARR